MEAFLIGITSILTTEVSLFLILSFLLIGKLSQSFPSHFVKIILFFLTTLLLYFSFVVFSPASVYIFFRSAAIILLILTVVLCLKFLGVFRSIKSKKLKIYIESGINWLAPIILGFWLFAQSLTSYGPILGSMMVSPMSPDDSWSGLLIPLFFGLGVAFTVSTVLALAWLFHDKFRNKRFWKVSQVLASVVALIFVLRTLIEVLFG